LVEQFLRDLASLRHCIEADRVAVALQIAELAFNFSGCALRPTRYVFDATSVYLALTGPY
ncbi:hypothetical protein ACXKGW_29545, partial [Klebsiella pneumoniae subsp. pneumoniae]